MDASIHSVADRNSMLLLWELRALWIAVLLYVLSFYLYLGWVFWPDSRSGRMASRLFLTGLVIHCVVLVLRLIEVERLPVRTQFEILVAISCMTALMYMAVEKRFRYIFIAGFPVSAICGVLCLYAILRCNPGGIPIFPAFRSIWFTCNAIIAPILFGAFTVAFSVEFGYVVLTRLVSPESLPKYCKDIGTAARFHRMTHQLTLFAFPLLTFGIFSSVLWELQAYGRYWSWYPRETWWLISWIMYALYLHAMTMVNWRGGRASILNTVGFASFLVSILNMDRIPELSVIANLDLYTFW
jgi:ABC-type transport system involved in cytochrome c biogenesis permease subunit